MAKPKGTTAERVTAVGAGYVGLVTAASLADLGHQVISMDIDSERIGRLQDGDIPIFEPGLAELVEKNRPRLTFTDDPTSPTRTVSSSTSVSTHPLPTAEMRTYHGCGTWWITCPRRMGSAFWSSSPPCPWAPGRSSAMS